MEIGEKADLERSKKMGVYEYVSRSEAMQDFTGKTVKAKLARVSKGSEKHPEVRCRLVAQELGCGERLDELALRRYPEPHGCAALADSRCGEGPFHDVVGCEGAFLYGSIRCNVYGELPHRDPRHGDGQTIGKLKKVMYATNARLRFGPTRSRRRSTASSHSASEGTLSTTSTYGTAKVL